MAWNPEPLQACIYLRLQHLAEHSSVTGNTSREEETSQTIQKHSPSAALDCFRRS